MAAALLSALLGVMALPSVWADGNPSASGHANLTIADGLQTYSFTAIQHGDQGSKDDRVSGELTLDSRGQDIILQGTVTCLEIVGNEARIGGIITHVTSNTDPEFPDFEGQPFEFRVVDNGEGSNDPIDEVSDVFIGPPAEGLCKVREGVLGEMLPIEAGNITVNP